MNSKYRLTPQTNLVYSIAKLKGHSTNLEILLEAKKDIPDLTATTVHRITKRLVKRGFLAEGPEFNGVQTIDANVNIHDHFFCQGCNKIKDFNISNELLNALASEAKIKIKPVSLTIYGDCIGCES